eukprot:gene15342-4595_t
MGVLTISPYGPDTALVKDFLAQITFNGHGSWTGSDACSYDGVDCTGSVVTRISWAGKSAIGEFTSWDLPNGLGE